MSHAIVVHIALPNGEDLPIMYTSSVPLVVEPLPDIGGLEPMWPKRARAQIYFAGDRTSSPVYVVETFDQICNLLDARVLS